MRLTGFRRQIDGDGGDDIGRGVAIQFGDQQIVVLQSQGEQYIRDVVKLATREALVAVGADIRKGYESEAGRLTTQVADMDGHVALLRQDFFNFKSGLTGREEKLHVLVGSAVDRLGEAVGSAEQTKETTEEEKGQRREFEKGVLDKLSTLEGLVKDVQSAKVLFHYTFLLHLVQQLIRTRYCLRF